MQDTSRAAKTNLSKLIEAALDGQEVIIAKGKKPVVQLVPVASGAFEIGPLKEELGSPPDFFEPMEEAELRLWEGGG